MNAFSICAERNLGAAGQNVYLSGACHPDRVMTEHDLVYILEGSWEICQDGEAFMLFPDDVIILYVGRHHYGLKPCQPHTRTMYIHAQCFPDEMDEAFTLPTVTHCRYNPKVRELFKNIVSEYSGETLFREAKLSRLFQLLLLEIAECVSATQNSLLLEKVLSILQSEPSRFFHAEEVAAQLFVSPRTLRNHFSAAFHKTFHQYQMDVKLERACILLRDYPEMTLAEMARNLGFCDEFHLGRAFRKKYGIPPGHYRRQKEIKL